MSDAHYGTCAPWFEALSLVGLLGWSNKRSGIEFYRYDEKIIPRHGSEWGDLLAQNEEIAQSEGCPVIVVVLPRATTADQVYEAHRIVADALREEPNSQSEADVAQRITAALSQIENESEDELDGLHRQRMEVRRRLTAFPSGTPDNPEILALWSAFDDLTERINELSPL
jgi:hypothetical protein